MKRLCVLLCVILLSFSFTSVFAIESASTSSQPVTVQSQEEYKKSCEKLKDAVEAYKALTDLRNKKITKAQFDAVNNKIRSKYGIISPNSNVESLFLPLLDPPVIVRNLNYQCYEQQTSYYCGPASHISFFMHLVSLNVMDVL